METRKLHTGNAVIGSFDFVVENGLSQDLEGGGHMVHHSQLFLCILKAVSFASRLTFDGMFQLLSCCCDNTPQPRHLKEFTGAPSFKALESMTIMAV